MSDNGHTSKKIELSQNITVRDLAQVMQKSPIDVIKALMSNGVMASINQPIDFDLRLYRKALKLQKWIWVRFPNGGRQSPRNL
jgi:hypothetical protein